MHKQLCQAQNPSKSLKQTDEEICQKLLFPLYEIVSEPDDFERKHADERGDISMALVPTFQQQCTTKSSDPWPEEEFEQSCSEVDKTFLRFQKRTRYDPDQVLRYDIFF
jgi:hypothetical protein